MKNYTKDECMPFKKGTEWQGNKNGRPVNSGYRQKLFGAFVEPHQDKLFNKAIELALSGNESILRLFLERMLPTKPIDDPLLVPMPEVGTTKIGSMLTWGETILQAISQGDMTPTQGNSLLTCIDIHRKNIETAELTTRVLEIERTLKHRKEKIK